MAAGTSSTTAVPVETSSPGEASSGTATGPRPAPRAPRITRPGVLGKRPWTTPRLVRALTALCAVALVITAAVAGSVLSSARGGIDTIGHQDGPQVVRAADLYFALSDMDAQAANLLLVGNDSGLATTRQTAQTTYEQRRTQADQDLQQAAQAAAGDPNGSRAVQSVLDNLGQYEALVARARLLEDQAAAGAGKPPAAALDAYRQATDLLRQQLLPAADQVIAANAATVNTTFTAQRGDLSAGWWEVLIVGLLTLAALVLLQRVLAVRYRRIVNPALAVATLLFVGVLGWSLSLVSGADRHLVTAKQSAYDSVIALSRARAVAYDSNADESRYLIDPSRADAYEQSFFDKTQQVLRIDGATLAGYNSSLDQLAAQHAANHSVVPFGGFIGDELRNVTFPGEQDAAEQLLSTYRTYQKDDRTIRDLRNQGRLRDAILFDTGTAAGQSDADFNALSDAFGKTLAVNNDAFSTEIAAADSSLGTTATAIGAVTLLAALTLLTLGIRPRLREYR